MAPRRDVGTFVKRRSKFLLLLILILVPLWVFGDPPVYFANEMHGQVVDAETGRALESVVVVVEWRLYQEGIGSGGRGGALNRIEVLTDSEGKYFVPGWGPRPRPPFTFLGSDPELRFFKSDFYPLYLSNEVLGEANRNRSMLRTSQWDGKVIKLMPFRGDWLDYGLKLGAIWSDLGDCRRDCPRLVLALDGESKRIKTLAPKDVFIPRIVSIDSFPQDDREFFKRFVDGK
jgi:hypothetical protein